MKSFVVKVMNRSESAAGGTPQAREGRQYSVQMQSPEGEHPISASIILWRKVDFDQFEVGKEYTLQMEEKDGQ